MQTFLPQKTRLVQKRAGNNYLANKEVSYVPYTNCLLIIVILVTKVCDIIPTTTYRLGLRTVVNVFYGKTVS